MSFTGGELSFDQNGRVALRYQIGGVLPALVYVRRPDGGQPVNFGLNGRAFQFSIVTGSIHNLGGEEAAGCVEGGLDQLVFR